MRRAPLVALVALVLAACGGGGTRAVEAPAPAEEEQPVTVDPALLAEIAAGLEEVLAAMAQISANPDCAAMGVDLGKLFDRSQPLFTLARAQERDPEASRLLAVEMDARGGRVAALAQTIGAGLERCRGDRGVVEAMQRMPTF